MRLAHQRYALIYKMNKIAIMFLILDKWMLHYVNG